MAYEMVQNGNTQFAIDWDIVRRLLRSYWTAELQFRYSRAVSMSDSRWYNPMSWSLPDVSQVEVDWDAVTRDAAANTEIDLQAMRRESAYAAARVAYELEGRVDTAARRKEDLLTWMGDIQTDNMRRINQAVEEYEAKADIARFVRDTSAEGLMVGASVMSGGAAVAVMGAGSILKGEAKFQDSGSVGAAVMEGTGSFVFAYVKLGKKFSFKEDMVLALVQAPWKAGTELVGGTTVGKSVLSGALKLTGPSVERLFKLGPAKTLFDKAAVPMVISYGGENKAAEVLGKFAGKLAQKQGVEKAGRDRLLGTAAPAREGERVGYDRMSRQGVLLKDATLTNKFLLYFAYVNMEKGIGRGW